MGAKDKKIPNTVNFWHDNYKRTTCCFSRLIVLSLTLLSVDFDLEGECSATLKFHVLGFIFLLTLCVIVEGSIVWVSMQGTILDSAPRAGMQYLIYVRLGMLLSWGNCFPNLCVGWV